jgi:hypothetical protein
MKGIIAALCIVAVANLLAVGAFVGWLKTSDRLDLERLRKVREVLAPTIAQEKQKKAEADATAAAEKVKAEEEAKRQRPPLTAEQQLIVRMEASQAEEQRAARLRTEAEALQRGLQEERQKLDASTKALIDARTRFEALQRETAELVGSAQFTKAVSVLTGLKPAEAKSALQQILDGATASITGAGTDADASRANGSGGGLAPALSSNGAAELKPIAATPMKSETGRRQVVAYLDAMEERVRNRIIAEFVKDDPALAAELLERLRTHGVLTGVAKANER